MRLVKSCAITLWVLLVGIAYTCEAVNSSNSSLPNARNDGTGVTGPLGPVQKRLLKDVLKGSNTTSSSNSTIGNNQQKRSTGKVEILEAGSNLRTRGNSRVLRRGPSFPGLPGAPGRSGAPGGFGGSGTPGAPGTRFTDTSFNVRNSITRNNGGYDTEVSFETAAGIPVIAIPGSEIPPPVYSYNGNIVPPAPPPSPSVTINGGGSSYGNPSSYRPGGNGGGTGGSTIIMSSTTPMPEIIFPPVTSGPGPAPIRPPTGTSVPIIGGGGIEGTDGGSVLPPSPPPEDIFPPAPPPDEDLFDEGVGRRLRLPIGRASGGAGGAAGSPGRPGGLGGIGSLGGAGSPGRPGGLDGIGGLGGAGSPGRSGGLGGIGGLGGAGSPGRPGGLSRIGGLGGAGSPGRPGGLGGIGGLGGDGGFGGLGDFDGAGSPGEAGGGLGGGAGGIGGGSVRARTRFGPPQSLSTLEKLRNGGTVRRERLRDKVNGFKNSVVDVLEPHSEEIVVDDPNVITDFVFSDIKCFKTRQDEYFGATIHMKSGYHLPYIRDRPQDPLTSEECRLDLVEGTRGSYHMSVIDLRGCGVEQCGEAMCLTMVFPRVPILALADDEVTTIKCIPQKSTMSDTKSISFAGDSMENRRSSSTVEGGIQEFVAEVGVFRQNPGAANGLFVKRVNSGGVVQLGEPLQLRSVVRGTDGWKHSKLTDVKVWRMRDNLSPKLDNLDPNDASEVITLVDPHGCRNEEYLVIADDHPIRDPRNDMVHHFTFKAFLFRGQRVNEPLIVTARVHACQEEGDCLMECGLNGRRKRSPVELHNASSIVHDYDTQLALRVVGLKDHPSSILDDEFPFDHLPVSSMSVNRTGLNPDIGTMTCNEKMFATGIGGGCIMLLICALALALYTYIKQGRLQSRGKPGSSPSAATTHYRYPPPPGRSPYQKPLPPTPTSSEQPNSSTQQPHNEQTTSSNDSKAARDESMSQVEKLLKELVQGNGSGDKAKSSSAGKSSNVTKKSGSKHKDPPSEYASIDETNSSSTSATSSSEDLRKSKRTKDGLYIVYCYDKEKKKKFMLPMSAPSSTRVRRKHLKQNGRMAEEDEYYDDEDFIDEGDDDSETMASQTEDATDDSDEYGEVGKTGRGNNVPPSNLAMNPGIRRTVREVKKKSKQNNVLAYASTRCKGNIRRRISSVYREGYFNGLRGVVSAAVGSKGGGQLRHKKSPSTGNIPESIAEGKESAGDYNRHGGGKRINFSVRERRSEKKRHQQKHEQDQYSSEGMVSDLDSAYSGSNCSKLTEVYEMKRGGGNGGNAKNISGPYPDFQKQQQNRMDVQRQLMRAAQGYNFVDKQDLRRTASYPNNSDDSTAFAIGLGSPSPPLPPGETKATHFVTRDDSTTKILIVPETRI